MRQLLGSADPATTVLAVDASAAPGIQRKLEADLEQLIPPLVSVGSAARSGTGWEVVWPAAERLEVGRVVAGLEGAPGLLRHTRVVLDEGPCLATLARVRKRLHRGDIAPGSVTDLRRTSAAARG